METTAAFEGLRCLDCGRDHGPAARACSDCGGPLEPAYDEAALDGERPPTPIPPARLPDLGARETPLVVLEEYDASVVLKAEGQTGTGSVADREMRVAVGLARALGAETVALPSTGNGAQSAAAYAARAGLGARAFVPSRSTFTNKAMVNAHGGEMSVVGGRYPAANEAFGETTDEESWHSLAPFETPYRHGGARAIAYELHETLGAVPDRVVVPTGHGTILVGLHRGFRELVTAGATERVPRLYAAQAAGCAPLVDAPVEHPDTVCGPLEVPDPDGGRYALAATNETDGGAVAVSDERLLAAATELTERGVPVSATGGAALAALEELSIAPEETVVVIDPVSVDREADLLRSHLMSKGI